MLEKEVPKEKAIFQREFFRHPTECIEWNWLENKVDTILDFCKQSQYICCYGAGHYGKSLKHYLESHHIRLSCFIISDDEINKEAIENISVYHLAQVPFPTDQIGIFLSLDPKWHGKVLDVLQERGYKKIYSKIAYEVFDS